MVPYVSTLRYGQSPIHEFMARVSKDEKTDVVTAVNHGECDFHFKINKLLKKKNRIGCGVAASRPYVITGVTVLHASKISAREFLR